MAHHEHAAHHAPPSTPVHPAPAFDTVTDTRIYTLVAAASRGCTLLNGSKLSSVLFDLPSFVDNSDSTSYVYVSVESANVPVSFYTITSANNTLTVNFINYTIPVGDYNITTMLTTLKTLLSAYVPTITYDYSTRKLTFYSTFAISIQPSTCSKVLGLGTSTLYQQGLFIYAPYCVSFLPPQRISFRSSLLHTGGVNSYDQSCNTLLSLPNNAAAGGSITFSGTTTRFLVEREHLGQLDLQVCDEFGAVLDFNNVPWVLSVRVESVIRRPASASSFKSILLENAERLSAYMDAQNDSFALEQDPLWYDRPSSLIAALDPPPLLSANLLSRPSV